MKTNFVSKTVSGQVSFAFSEMAIMTSIFETAAMEAVEKNEHQEAQSLINIADTLGFVVDVDVDVDVPDFTQEPVAGQDSEEIE